MVERMYRGRTDRNLKRQLENKSSHHQKFIKVKGEKLSIWQIKLQIFSRNVSFAGNPSLNTQGVAAVLISNKVDVAIINVGDVTVLTINTRDIEFVTRNVENVSLLTRNV